MCTCSNQRSYREIILAINEYELTTTNKYARNISINTCMNIQCKYQPNVVKSISSNPESIDGIL